MKRLVLEGFVAANLIVGFSVQSWAQQPVPQQADIGKAEYQSSCAACHGADGKGKGPLSGVLKSTPQDLTVLAKKNNGVFPINAVYEMIDGRKAVEAHGTREMPIWGFRYMPSPYEAVNPRHRKHQPLNIGHCWVVEVLLP